MKTIQGISNDKITEVLTFSYQFFNHLMNKLEFDYYLINLADVNWDVSPLLIDDEDKIKGVYLLGNHQLTSMLDIDEFFHLKGIEGVLLCVDESIRGLGYGNELKDYPKTLGYDYIWGRVS